MIEVLVIFLILNKFKIQKSIIYVKQNCKSYHQEEK
jgi:hypothetical protein